MPPDDVAAAGEEDAAELVGVRHALHVRPFVVFLAVAFVGMGVFNGISTWVEEIVRPRGFSSADAGTLGALLLLGGIVGAVVLSALSDRARKRVPFLTLSLALSAPALVWLALAQSHVGLFCRCVRARASSSPAPCRSACSTPPRSRCRRRRAPPTG